jgi:hypothetical protein
MTAFMRTMVLAVLAFLSGPAAAQGVAFVTNLRGEVTVEGNARPLVLSELARGAKLAVGNDAAVSVMYTATGREFTLKGPGKYEIGDKEVATVSGAPASARNTEWRADGKVLTQVAKTSGASVRMRSMSKPKADPGPKLLFPTQGGIATVQPAFRWTSENSKALSDFTLLVPGVEKPVLNAKTEGSLFRLPPSIKLKPDTEYAWVVSTGGQEIGTAKFRTLSVDTMKGVEKRRPSAKADFSDHVLFAMYLQEVGAAQEAQELWARLAKERTDLPELSGLAR